MNHLGALAELPLLNKAVEVQPQFSIQKLVDYQPNIEKYYINDRAFPQINLSRTKTATLEISQSLNDCTGDSIFDYLDGQLGKKNFSQGLIRVLHDILVSQPEVLNKFHERSILVPVTSHLMTKAGFKVYLALHYHHKKWQWRSEILNDTEEAEIWGRGVLVAALISDKALMFY